MEDPLDFSELDEILASIEAPMYHDFLADETSRPDSPSWFCARIGCNGEHEHAYFKDLERNFENLVIEPRTPSFGHSKAVKMVDARPPTRHGRSAPAKLVAAMRDRSVAAKALVPKKMAVEPMSTTCAQKRLRKKWTDSPILKSNIGGKSDASTSAIVKDQLISSHSPTTSNLKVSVQSVIPNSLSSTNPDPQTISEAFVVHASCQGYEIEDGVSTTKLEDNKDNISSTKSLEVNFEKSVEVSVIHASCQGSEAEVVDAMSLEENCEKPNIIKKSIKEPSKTLHLKQHGHAEKSKRTTKPKPFRLLTNERGAQRETNLERKQKLESPKGMVSTLKCRNGVKSDARLAQGKTGSLGLDKQTTNNPKSQKEKPAAKTQKEVSKVASSRKPLQTSSPIAKRNTPSSATQGNKYIQSNARLRCTDVVRSEARADQSRNIQFAGKLLATLPQSQKKECRKEKLCEQSREDAAKVAPSRQSLKSQRKMPARNLQTSSHHQKEVVTDNVTCSQEKEEQLVIKGSRLLRAAIQNVLAFAAHPAPSDRRVWLSDMCSQPIEQRGRRYDVGAFRKSEELRSSVLKMAPSGQSLSTQSKMAVRKTQSSSQRQNGVVVNGATCSQGKPEQLRKEAVNVALSKQFLKPQSKMPSKNAQSSSQHQNEVVTDNATCSQGRRSAATTQGPSSRKTHTTKDCTKKPLRWR